MTTKEAFEVVLNRVEIDIDEYFDNWHHTEGKLESPYFDKLKEAFEIILDYKNDLIRR
jgi:hypothetical protein|tara:strand:+ start:810 stop:983 length:174 start_codon:yes stop_codon:yes gene_type:complete